MSNFTEDEVKQIFKLIKENGDFNPATDRNCNGTLSLIERMETRGVKLIVSSEGIKGKIQATNVCDFIDSPCIWIGENGKGRWAGLQGGWPVKEQERQEELEYDSIIIRCDRNRYPDPDIERPAEFMRLERYKKAYIIPVPGWFSRAELRIDLYKALKARYPEWLAARIARDITFDFYNHKPLFKRLALGYIRSIFIFLIKSVVIILAIFGLWRLSL